jgi:uncharacterized glyoxalase superfamily protein PhnB
MPETPTPALIPMLSYADAPAAIEFLGRAFGFQELYRLEMPDGRIGHAELGYDGVRVMLASEYPALGLESPKALDTRYSQIFVYVEDVDAHYDRARDAGATIAAEPADQDHGHRMYRAMDPEGHRWLFAQRLPESA